MPVILIIIGAVILYIAWDYLFYAVGGVIGLMALGFFLSSVGKKDSSPLTGLIMAAVCCGLSYCAFNYQVNSWHNPELIARQLAQEEKEAAEKKAREEAERNQKFLERANQLSGYEKDFFDSKFQEHLNSGLDENSAREKALTELDAMLQAEAEEKRESEEAKSQTAPQPEPAKQGRIDIESLKSVNSNVLADQVIEYINSNPDKKGRLINYVINLNLLSREYDSAIRNKGKSDEKLIADSIPLIGGLLLDKSWDSFVSRYKQAIVNEITDDEIMRKLLEKYHENRPGKGFTVISDTTYNILSNMYLIDPDDVENYNALIKIAAIKYHSVEAYAEDHKGRFSLEPGILDVADIVSYAAFSAKDNREKYQSAQQALARICSALSIDLKNYGTKESITKYFASLIPKYMFAYELEETYLPADKNAVFSDDGGWSVKPAERKRIYEMMSGTWRSLLTDETVVLKVFPENDDTPKAPKVNYIDVLDKKEPYARFNYIIPGGNRINIFITPALYVKDGRKTKVLAMYLNYKLIKGDETSIYRNGRIDNISSAEDVLVKELN